MDMKNAFLELSFARSIATMTATPVQIPSSASRLGQIASNEDGNGYGDDDGYQNNQEHSLNQQRGTWRGDSHHHIERHPWSRLRDGTGDAIDLTELVFASGPYY
jgi:hypothetical protein